MIKREVALNDDSSVMGKNSHNPGNASAMNCNHLLSARKGILTNFRVMPAGASQKAISQAR